MHTQGTQALSHLGSGTRLQTRLETAIVLQCQHARVNRREMNHNLEDNISLGFRVQGNAQPYTHGYGFYWYIHEGDILLCQGDAYDKTAKTTSKPRSSGV